VPVTFTALWKDDILRSIEPVMTGRKFRTILLIAISALLGILTFKVAESVWRGSHGGLKKKAADALVQYLPDAALKIKDFHRAQVEGDRKIWEVFADEARYIKSEKKLVVEKTRIFFYQKDHTTIEATGSEGNLWMGEGQSELEKAQLLGSVQVNFRGYVLTTNEILYFKSKNMMILPGRVTVRGAGMELDGGQMEISLNDEILKLNKSVKTKVQPSKLQNMKGRPDEKDEKKDG
jgi:LPS export ABC transporter protein LptC